MTSGFKADTSAVAQTSQKAEESVDAIAGFFKKMQNDSSTVLLRCQGPMFTSVTEAMIKLQADRDKMLQQLQTLSDSLKKGGQGMDGQSSAGASRVRGAAGSALSVPMNTHTR